MGCAASSGAAAAGPKPPRVSFADEVAPADPGAPAPLCPPCPPADGAGSIAPGSAGTSSAELLRGRSDSPQLRRRSSLTKLETDQERLGRTVWIGNIPINLAIPEKLLAIFEEIGVPQSCRVKIKPSADVHDQTAWSLLTFKRQAGALEAVKREWVVSDAAGASVTLLVKPCDADKALSSSLSTALSVKQWGIAYSNRWGHCTVHAACTAYSSHITFRGSEGGGPCATCGCYPAAHIHLGRYPNRCAIEGCACEEFRPENDPTNAVLPGDFGQAHRNDICGLCGHAGGDHTAPYDTWEVRWPDIDILEKLGEGRHGRVHRCMLWNKEYAVKILKNENWNADALSNFLREMSTLSQLRHPHIQELVAGVTDTKAARKVGQTRPLHRVGSRWAALLTPGCVAGHRLARDSDGAGGEWGPARCDPEATGAGQRVDVGADGPRHCKG